MFHRESQAIEVHFERRPAQIRARFESVAQRVRRGPESGGRIRIVEVDHRPLGSRRAFRREQQPLGREILFHGVVEIQVIPREVRKYSSVKRNTVDPSQRQRVG